MRAIIDTMDAGEQQNVRLFICTANKVDPEHTVSSQELRYPENNGTLLTPTTWNLPYLSYVMILTGLMFYLFTFGLKPHNLLLIIWSAFFQTVDAIRR